MLDFVSLANRIGVPIRERCMVLVVTESADPDVRKRFRRDEVDLAGGDSRQGPKEISS